MTARRRVGTRARRTRYLPRHAAQTQYRSVDHTADALADADLTALADSLYGPDGRRQTELIAACDTALWELELGSAP